MTKPGEHLPRLYLPETPTPQAGSPAEPALPQKLDNLPDGRGPPVSTCAPARTFAWCTV